MWYRTTPHDLTLNAHRFSCRYYEVVQAPMDLKTIKANIAKGGYSYDDIVYDLNLMLTNTRMYYPPESPQWLDACALSRCVFAFCCSPRSSLISDIDEDVVVLSLG